MYRLFQVFKILWDAGVDILRRLRLRIGHVEKKLLGCDEYEEEDGPCLTPCLITIQLYLPLASFAVCHRSVEDLSFQGDWNWLLFDQDYAENPILQHQSNIYIYVQQSQPFMRLEAAIQWNVSTLSWSGKEALPEDDESSGLALL